MAVKTKKAVNLLPMLIKPNPGVANKEFEALLKKLEIETKPVYSNIVFGQVPLARIKDLVKISKLQHIEKQKPPSFGGHELLISRTLLLEKTLASIVAKKGKALDKQQLLALVEDSKDNREDFKHNISRAHVVLKRDHEEILADAYKLIGKNELVKQMTALARKEIASNTKNKLYAAKMTKVIEKLRKD